MKIGDYENLVFFDTETTGVDAKNNRIIELAAYRVTKTGAKSELDSFILLPKGESIPKEIVELTHITDEMLLKEGRSEELVLNNFYQMIKPEKTLLIAHNAQFDLNFVGHSFMRYLETNREWIKAFSKADYLDSLTVFKDRHAYPHKLENAIQTYHLEDKVVNSHRAVDDCIALFEVVKAMAEERDDLSEYVNTFGYNAKYGVSGDKLKKVAYGQQPFRKQMAPADKIFPFCLELFD